LKRWNEESDSELMEQHQVNANEIIDKEEEFDEDEEELDMVAVRS